MLGECWRSAAWAIAPDNFAQASLNRGLPTADNYLAGALSGAAGSWAAGAAGAVGAVGAVGAGGSGRLIFTLAESRMP